MLTSDRGISSQYKHNTKYPMKGITNGAIVSPGQLIIWDEFVRIRRSH